MREGPRRMGGSRTGGGPSPSGGSPPAGASSPDRGAGAAPPPLGHETEDLGFRVLVVLVAGIGLLVGVTLLLMAWLFGLLEARQGRLDVSPSPLAEERQLPPEPVLEVAPGEELRRLRATEEALLQQYAWVDPEAGIVRIPIDRAMELLAEEGSR